MTEKALRRLGMLRLRPFMRDWLELLQPEAVAVPR
jgi:hypothetical protein